MCEKAFAIGGPCPNDGARLIRLVAAVDPFLGRDLDGKYMILERLGVGGMGAVYRAEQRGLGREVAVKVVSSSFVTDPEVIKRFLREAKLASILSHPNAVGVIDFGQTEDGVCYLVMELVTGRTLDQALEEEGPFRVDRLVRIAIQICDALEGAHTLQIIHRDLKPANVMLLAQGRDLVKVLDFGLAKSIALDQSNAHVTTTGALLGTPSYMSPEVARGEVCDARADLYALGVLLFLLGSGELPFQSASPHELVSMHGSVPAPPMRGVPQAIADVIDRLLRKDPAERYQTAAETRDAIEAAYDQIRNTPLPISTTPPPTSVKVLGTAPTTLAAAETPAKALPASQPRPRRLAPVLAAMVVVGIGAYALTRGNEPSPPAAVPDPAATPTSPSIAAPAVPELTVDAAVAAEPVAAEPAPIEAPAVKTVETKKPVRKIDKPKRTKRDRSKPIKRVETKPPPTTGTGSGSGETLPF